MTGPDQSVFALDLTGASPAVGTPLTSTDFSGLSNYAIGPTDACTWLAVRQYRESPTLTGAAVSA